MNLQHFLISQATSTHTTTVLGTESAEKQFKLNVYLQKPKPDASNQKLQVVLSGDGDCNLPFWGRILDLKAVCQFSSKANVLDMGDAGGHGPRLFLEGGQYIGMAHPRTPIPNAEKADREGQMQGQCCQDEQHHWGYS